MTHILEDIDASAWHTLAEAVNQPDDAFRYLSLSSVDADGQAQARTLVLRRATQATRQLEFHTDIRSEKWQELAMNPRVTVLGYSHQSRLQLRLQGSAQRYDADSELAARVWRSLPAHTQSTYTGGPPGDARDSSGGQSPESADNGAGKARFGVIIVQVNQLDWYQLQRGNNQRALLPYNDAGMLDAARWVNP